MEPLKQLFWSELNYDRINQPLSQRCWNQTAANALFEDPVLFAGGGQNNDFHIIYCRLPDHRLLSGQERPVVHQLLKEHTFGLFIFSNKEQDHWHFINVKYDNKTDKRRLFRRISVSPEERLRTASERIAMLDLQSMQSDLFGLQPMTIQSKHDEAFDVEAVTKQFFEEYKAVFRILEDDLKKQSDDQTWAHDYSLQFLNRCMFIYFIQRKGWLGNDCDFLYNFWKSYQRSRQGQNSFVDNWLNVLFFEAFNNKFHGGHTYLPEEIKEALSLAPYLNGGLFTKNNFDRDHKAIISDRRFEQVLTFLERFNFTIAEDSPLDKEVAVDPEMIGKVYESLVNVSEEIDKRGDAGIFYTPRTEIDLMCRLSLVDNLANHLGENNKELLYQLVFALEPDEKIEADRAVAKAGMWVMLNERLNEIAVLDPACGSASFLVGMLTILDDLQERANRQLNITESSYERKKRIIGQSLYGVDIMEWACHVAELRLWLALIIDAEFTREELHIRHEPLLPHFSFNIRCGDSLVQEVGGINLGHIASSHEITPSLKARITGLKNEKLKFYNNDRTCKFPSVETLKSEEKRLFSDILDARIHGIQERIKSLQRKLEGPQTYQIGLDGKGSAKPHQIDFEAAKYRQEIESLTTELVQVEASQKVIAASKEVPLVWDIAFVEIFESEKDGFDIVVGNPPYVRQEAISDPRLPRDEVTTENKKVYKEKLARSVYQAFPHFFGYNQLRKTAAKKIDAKSDLYIYFYLHGLSLLNKEGSFCFITSNSWLDVGYGAELQEFLLKHNHVKLVLDNQVKRTFANADVNSVIVLFSATNDRREWALEKITRFVMFRVPFEHIVSAVIFDEIEEAAERKAAAEYRVFPIQQAKLLEDGCEISEEEENGKAIRGEKTQTAGPLIKIARYIGNKWGGKYLRAPDIYWTILEKGRKKAFQTIGTASWLDLGRGRRTGADKFFYLDEKIISEFRVEKEFLLPLIKSPTQFSNIGPATSNLSPKYFVFICDKKRTSLRGTNALEFIKWGETKSFNESNLAKVDGLWWNLGLQDTYDIILPIAFSDRFFAVHNDAKCEVHQRFATIRVNEKRKKHIISLVSFLNSTITALEAEILGRRNLGLGALDFPPDDWKYVIVPNPDQLGINASYTLESVWNAIKKRAPKAVSYEIQSDDKKQLDSIVADFLNLTKGEVDAVCEAVINLVEARLKKANSV
ncbi:MAG TPA: hypothetical protein DCX22_00035 [Dehalococcoidia bacterium]|nr:hypothetical protein [Dehalococcoidia bacterium]